MATAKDLSAVSEAAPARVSLREITADTVRSVVDLSVRSDQIHFVATNAISLAQALFSPEAWYRAIYSDEELVGFVMLYDEALRPQPPETPEVALWRLMIDGRFQGRGIGAAALGLVIAHVRAKGLYSVLEVSYMPGEGCPEPFYRKFGFEPTGRVDGGEIVLGLRVCDAKMRV